MAEKTSFWQRLIKGLTKTRDNFIKSMDYVFNGFTNIDEDFYEELEEVLIMGDIGVRTTENILDDLRDAVKKEHIKEPAECKEFLINEIKQQMSLDETSYAFEKKTSVVLVIGVNGVGKTTTIGKLAGKLKAQGKKVMVAGADTFRAAASDQLRQWADRASVEFVGGPEGSDPAAVVYDAVHAAKARGVDVLLVDTAGRLHNKKNLMNELSKINSIIKSEYPEAVKETLVVVDASTGQNAKEQAKEFKEVTDVSGVILTKLDGSAKGGIVIAIENELKIPVKFVGLGERVSDLRRFDTEKFMAGVLEE